MKPRHTAPLDCLPGLCTAEHDLPPTAQAPAPPPNQPLALPALPHTAGVWRSALVAIKVHRYEEDHLDGVYDEVRRRRLRWPC